MNHLRELLEEKSVEFDPSIHIETINDCLTWLYKVAKEAVCFDVGDFHNTYQITLLPEIARLPFRKTWIEGYVEFPSGKSVTMGVLAEETFDNLVDLCAFRRQSDTRVWDIVGSATEVNLETGVFKRDVSSDHVHSLIRYTVHALRAFCSAINCQNVGRQEHKPDTALQKARAKRGKQPLFSYWTLELNGRDGGAAQSFGGTHASPRVHLRRGHPRQYAPGKWTWVQPHAVGNRELGMVHKDYVIGKEMVVH